MQTKENRRKVRVRLSHMTLPVLMGSIGSEVRYNLLTKDLSNHGFFLDFEKPGRFPFTPDSIMEIWLTLDKGNTIFFNGKMARVVHPKDEAAKFTGPGIAVRIVQIEPEQEKLLHNFIAEKLETKEAVEVTANGQKVDS
mgnify:CR=1 FL=1